MKNNKEKEKTLATEERTTQSNPSESLYLTLGVFFLGYSLLLLIFPKLDFEVVAILITITTFLLSILIGFSISRGYNRLESIREELRVNDARFVNIYEQLTLFNSKAESKEIVEYMDSYLVAQVDHELRDFGKTGSALHSLYAKVLSTLEPHSFKQEQAYEAIINNMDAMLVAHKKVSHLVLNHIPKHEWHILWFLSASLWLSLLLMETSGFLVLVTALIGTALCYLLLLLRSVDSLKWEEREWIWKPLTQLFLDLNLKPYIPEPVYQKGRLDDSFLSTLPSYRFVRYNRPYPDMSEKSVSEQIGRPQI